MRLVAGCAKKVLYHCRRRPLTCLACCVLLLGWIALVNRAMELRDVASSLNAGRETVAKFGECPDGGNLTCIAFATGAFGGYAYWENILGRDSSPGCSADCRLVSDSSRAHGLLFHAFDLPSKRRLRHLRQTAPAGQFWIYYSLESPVHLVTNRCIRQCQHGWSLVDSFVAYAKEFVFPSYLLRSYPPETTEEAGFFNWTITYRRDSTIYTPYGRIAVAAKPSGSSPPAPETTLLAPMKRHLSFIVVSNCHPYNKRQEVLTELGKHMELHIYGACGDRRFSTSMAELSKQYYFHLSFENAYCRDYITEKFFFNGLSGYAVPVVFGGFDRTDYEAVAPPNSFVYAGDFKSAASLSARLKHLAANPVEYATYHRWRQTHSGVDSAASRQLNLFCQLCDRLRRSHGSRAPPLDLNKFYSSASQCRPADFDPFVGDS